MVGAKTKVAVVGDDDQSIYWWRGSIVDYLIRFRKRIPSVKTAMLEANFRSTTGVVSLGQKFIERNRHRLPKKMTAGNPFKSKHTAPDIQHCHFGTEAQQAKFVVSRMKELVGSDFVDNRARPSAISYGDMAVLIRTNADIRRFLPYLVEAGIPHVVDSGEIVFEQEIVTLTMACLDWIFRRNDQKDQSCQHENMPEPLLLEPQQPTLADWLVVVDDNSLPTGAMPWYDPLPPGRYELSIQRRLGCCDGPMLKSNEISFDIVP